jgi:Cd2+/Zn2+-exporting ATPase
MMTGDSEANAKDTAEKLGITEYYSKLLPADKTEKVENMIKNGYTTAFAGDGVNDAPVLMRADIGIAMGALGSDSAIEAADVVITDDDISRIPAAIEISKYTMRIVKQNIVFAIGVKFLFLFFGAVGLMTMWGAVFADVGVTLIAVLNSLRILRK